MILKMVALRTKNVFSVVFSQIYGGVGVFGLLGVFLFVFHGFLFFVFVQIYRLIRFKSSYDQVIYITKFTL